MSFFLPGPSVSAAAVKQTGACSPAVEVEAVHSGRAGVGCSLTVAICAAGDNIVVGDNVGLLAVQTTLAAALLFAVFPLERLEIVGGQEPPVSDNLAVIEGRRI